MAFWFGKKELEVEGKEKRKKHIYFNAFMMPYGMKGADEREEDFWLREDQFKEDVEEFLDWQ